MWKWLRNRFGTEERETDLADELRSHVEIETRRQIEQGVEPLEAARRAQRLFGSSARIQEDVREIWGWAALRRFYEDARFGGRLLRKSPAWTLVTGSTLALKIGLSTAIFSVVYSVLLQPLPYPEPDRVVALSAPGNGYPRLNVSAALWRHWQTRTRSFQEIALTRPVANFNLTGAGEPERLQGARVSCNLSSVLRVAPVLGRNFHPEECRQQTNVVLLSHTLWRRRFDGDPRVVGRKLMLNGIPHEVVGVMPASYVYPHQDFQLWAPLFVPPAEIRHGQNNQYLSVARLAAGVTYGQARADLDSAMKRLAEEVPDVYGGRPTEFARTILEPLARSDAFFIRDTLYAVMAASACLLLIGSLSLGLLLVARAAARSRELAVRAVLGAGRRRLLQQILAEVLPLGLAGAIGGVVLAYAVLTVLVSMLPPNTPRLSQIGLHVPVLLFGVAASLGVVLAAALLPACAAFRNQPLEALQSSSRTVSARAGLRNALVVVQIALSLVLLLNGSLFVRSFRSLMQVDPGFSSEGILTMHLAVSRAKYESDPQVAAYYDRLLERIRAVPGVQAAGVVNRLPLSGLTQTGGVEFEGIPGSTGVDWRSATPGYFDAMAIPLERGRSFEVSDREKSPLVGVIDSRLARQVFGNADPIGRRFRGTGGDSAGPWTSIVGVAGHIHNDSPEADARSQVYWPEAQRTQDRGAIVIRTLGQPQSFLKPVLEQIHLENSDQPVYDVRTMGEWLNRARQTRTLLTSLVTLFAAASLLLAALGLYGVVAYTAGLRLREFGIRLALGARGGQVRRLVLSHAALLSLLGCAIGLLLAWPCTQVVRSLLFGVTANDTLSWMSAPALLIAVGLLSGLGPARKAASVDPAVTLRLE